MNIESFATQLTNGSMTGFAAVAVAFFGGIVAGFGPCVLPMVPAVFGYVTGTVGSQPQTQSSRTAGRSLILSGAFVLGMSLVFSAIGAAAGLVGHAILVGAWAYYAVAAICVVIGLQMLGVIEIPVDRLNRWLPQKRPERGGLVGALLFGMMFGVVATPCSTPILAAIATLAAASGNAAKGAGLLFVYGLGKGVPLLLLGVASGSLAFMRSLSRFTSVLTKVGGVTLLGAAAYLVWLA